MPEETNKQILLRGLWGENPVLRQVLGICSALAVTNLMMNTLIMGVALIFVTAMSGLTVSLLRTLTPAKIRMMAQVLIISTYVILVDIYLSARMPAIHKELGPYVGLIITNCIIMGRCEGFARSNRPGPAFVDGLACGMGYALVLLSVAFIRELLGFGTLFGYTVLPLDWPRWTIMAMAPAAFFVLGTFLWIINTYWPAGEKPKA